MNSRKTINREVNITALYFRNSNRLKSFPRRMEYDGREYIFKKSGLQYQVTKDNQDLRLFDMTDGSSQYRLRYEQVNLTWVLVSITKSLTFVSQ